ncbi:hypothetical protein HIM_05402 [Hirsutella minnesotensis 3608]|uniref:Arb2 domain-containing protein n=1 Tax=Hirsutella minnesotensis 3608 TaxID=1043627 RepID=A0A0F7ZUP2_9HYPO|nr:hypothetical protein HIM_05402 [Hirsutella minnesotensis 3608]
MFRRHWSGLPKDPSFSSDLKSLGYFINEDDEVRSIENPGYYFKFFLNRNARVNARQRFAFDQALEREIHERLEARGLQKVRLPLGARPDEPHVPVLTSAGLGSKSHVVIVVGEPSQDLGVLALRVVNGPGGIDKGSAGQLHWWPEGGRGLRVTASSDVALPSAVYYGRRHVSALNSIPSNENPARHVAHVFDTVVRDMTSPSARISVVAVGESCELMTKFLDDEANWAAWGPRLNCMVLLGNVYPDDGLENPALKQFLAKASHRARAYVVSDLPLGSPLAPPSGNPREGIPNLGCPCYASSEALYTEMILVRDLASVLEYVQQAALAPDFENPPIVVVERPEEPALTDDAWANVPEHELPSISTAASCT